LFLKLPRWLSDPEFIEGCIEATGSRVYDPSTDVSLWSRGIAFSEKNGTKTTNYELEIRQWVIKPPRYFSKHPSKTNEIRKFLEYSLKFLDPPAFKLEK